MNQTTKQTGAPETANEAVIEHKERMVTTRKKVVDALKERWQADIEAGNRRATKSGLNLKVIEVAIVTDGATLTREELAKVIGIWGRRERNGLVSEEDPDGHVGDMEDAATAKMNCLNEYVEEMMKHDPEEAKKIKRRSDRGLSRRPRKKKGAETSGQQTA